MTAGQPASLYGRAVRVASAGFAGYALGSVLASGIVSKIAASLSGAEVDLRTAGSGNPGAANAIALLGKRWGIAILAGDMAKGAAAAQIGRILAGDAGAYLAATTAVAGHCFPLWSRFRGGKGVATSAGTTLVCFPVYVPIDVGLVAVSWAASRHAAVATIAASAAFVVAAWTWHRRGLGNAWGPKPTAGLPLYALATSSLLGYKFWAGRKR